MGIPFMVRDSLFLYININYKVMSSFTPVWHPSEATNSFRLYNNIANEEDYDGSLYYDTDNNYIDMPKIFNYKKIDDSIYIVTKVSTNSASDDPIFDPSLPSTEGIFTINKLIADEGKQTPTIDIYCNGEIKFANTSPLDGHWDLDEHSWVTLDSYSVYPSIYDTGKSDYDLNRQLEISYHTTSSFISSDWTHSQFWIKFTANWGKDLNGNYIVAQSPNNQGPIYLPQPTTFIPDVTPTLTVWIRQYAKQSGGGGGGETPGPGGIPSSVTVKNMYSGGATGYAGDNYSVAVFVRSGTYTCTGERYNAWLISGTFYDDEGTASYNSCAINKDYCE